MPCAGQTQATATTRPEGVSPIHAAGTERVAELEQRLREKPGDPALLLQLGEACENAGLGEQAKSAYHQALDRDSSLTEARRALERLGEIGWSDEEVLARADRLLTAGRLPEAAYLYDRFLRSHPGHERALAGRARARGAQPTPTVEPPPPVQPTPVAANAVPPAKVEEPRLPTTAGTGTPPAPAPAKSAAEEPLERPQEVAPTAIPARSSAAAAPNAPAKAAEALAPPEPSPETTEQGPVPLRSERPSAFPIWLAPLVGLLAGGAWLAWRQAVRARRPTVAGELASFPLADVLQFLGMGGNTGRLEITTGARRATVWLLDGRIVDATVGARSGKEALFELLGIDEGKFGFVERAVPTPLRDQAGFQVQQVLLEWADRVDQRNKDAADGLVSELLGALDDELLDQQLPS